MCKAGLSQQHYVGPVGRRVAVRLPWLAVALLPIAFYAFVAHNLVLASAAVIMEVVVFAGVWLARHPARSRHARASLSLRTRDHHLHRPW